MPSPGRSRPPPASVGTTLPPGGAGRRRGGRAARARRGAAGDADWAGRGRQDPAGGGGGQAAGETGPSARAPPSCRWIRSPTRGRSWPPSAGPAGADLARAGRVAGGAGRDVRRRRVAAGVLDNLEQVVQVAPDLGELLARCPGVAILATSRTVLGLRAEREYPVPPLALPGISGHRLGRGGGGPAWRWRCSWTGPARCGQDLPSPRATRRRWRRSAVGWRGFRWRSSWPPPAPGCWTRPRCWTGSAASLDALGTGVVDLPSGQWTLRDRGSRSVSLLEDAEGCISATGVDLLPIPGHGPVRKLGVPEIPGASVADRRRHALVRSGGGRVPGRFPAGDRLPVPPVPGPVPGSWRENDPRQATEARR